MNIFGSKSGNLHFPNFFLQYLFDYQFSEFCSTFGTLLFEKNQILQNNLEKIKKKLLLLLKWSLLEPKMFIVQRRKKLCSTLWRENLIWLGTFLVKLFSFCVEKPFKILTFLPNNVPKNKGVDSLMYAKLNIKITNMTNLFIMMRWCLAIDWFYYFG